MNAILSFFIFALLLVVGVLGGIHFQTLFGIVIPYAAGAVFLGGFVYKIVDWGRSPVPFRIPTTCGQEKSLPWVKNSFLDNPHNLPGVVGRMALEVLFFRSLFRNTSSELRSGPRVTYAENKWLWLAALAFHWSFLVIVVRHFRFFVEPVPFFVIGAQALDGFMEIWLPVLYLSDISLVAAATFLFLRRVVVPQLRYLSLPADYLPLYLVLGIAGSGILMRYFVKVDVVAVKELILGLLSFRPHVPGGIGAVFFVHLFLVCVLFGYFPFSKLMHMGGVFLSPTRNLANNNRMKRHINPWNAPVKVHTYAEYEDEFREVMKGADMPLEKDS